MKPYVQMLAIAVPSVTSIVVAVINKNENPLLAVVLALFSILLICLYLLMGSRRAEIPDSALRTHPFWSRFTYMIEHRIPSIKVKDNPLLTKLVRQCLDVKFRYAKKHMKYVINNKAFNCKDYTKFVSNLVRSYEGEWVRNHVPELFIERFRAFHKLRVDDALEYVERICSSNFYPTLNEKKLAMMDYFLQAFNHTMMDMERSVDSLNGDVTKELERLRKLDLF